jgi:hypothetical protein
MRVYPVIGGSDLVYVDERYGLNRVRKVAWIGGNSGYRLLIRYLVS